MTDEWLSLFCAISLGLGVGLIVFAVLTFLTARRPSHYPVFMYMSPHATHRYWVKWVADKNRELGRERYETLAPKGGLVWGAVDTDTGAWHVSLIHMPEEAIVFQLDAEDPD
jgi:hypothetical protein